MVLGLVAAACVLRLVVLVRDGPGRALGGAAGRGDENRHRGRPDAKGVAACGT